MQHSPAMFIGDAPAMDFLNSIATPVDIPVDWLDDGEGLLDWLEQAGLVPAQALHSIRIGARPGELDEMADQARQLREWFRGFVLEHKRQTLPADALLALEPLNRLLDRDDRFSRIVAGDHGDGFELQTLRRWRSPEALLLPVVETLATFVCEESFADVKACEGPACTLLFVDHTRGHKRRWCSMALCGNRAKQAAHRQRLKAR
ncbi:hypothetical protein FJV76_00670 [Mesorhizobium sp. WSM4303]|uniref:CGNR zinc finger domain-containing protein n=1 Tax=unclassified Mesorhizobium TaxID=325217 RepID=UPI00115E5F46|nr:MULTISPECIES: ABATE domain-containing protein [unclassified Mesorhizobium]TRC97472.1 hypothetical protein FJV77_10065 [Mesorhizobium sp. WSM4306]TRD08829.1 hypothetical protein FJV76_00670 [Mesorhizobium sp. WSM4303]